jgi:hypothetical protein
MVIDT